MQMQQERDRFLIPTGFNLANCSLASTREHCKMRERGRNYASC